MKISSPKQRFCSSLECPFPIHFFDGQGVVTLNREQVAILTLTTHGTVDHFRRFDVQVVNLKYASVVARKLFLFDDYLDPACRSDDRSDYNGSFQVIQSLYRADWTWCIAVPESTRPFTEAIQEWIELFRYPGAKDAADESY